MIAEEVFEKVIQWPQDHIRIQNPKGGKPLPFRPNKAQRDFQKKTVALRLKGKSDVVVKPRQVGMSTYLLCLILSIAVNVPGINIVWLGSSEKNHKAIKRKFRIIYNSAKSSPGSGLTEMQLTNNYEEITLNNGSSIVFLWAGQTVDTSKDSGRGDTLHLLICSEAAFWALGRDTYEAIRPGIEKAGASIVWESTPHGTCGVGELFYQKAMQAFNKKIDAELHFWQWWWDATYRRPCDRQRMIESYTTEEKELVENFRLEPEQIAWRRYQIEDLGGLGAFLVAYPEVFAEAFNGNARTIFNAAVLRRTALRLTNLGRLSAPLPEIFKVPAAVAFAHVLREETSDGYFRLYRAAQPRKMYFIGIDAAQGVPGGDYLCATIIDEEAKVCAQLWCLIHPIHFSWMVQLIAIYFMQTEHVGIEDKSTGDDIHRYLTTEIGDREISEHNAHPVLKLFQAAFMVANNHGTRPNLIRALIQHIDCGAFDIPDEETLHEANAMKVNKDGKIEAAPGEHDDRMMSGAIALRVRENVLPRYEGTTILEINDEKQEKSTQDKYAYIDTTKRHDSEREERNRARYDPRHSDDVESDRQAGSIWDLL